MHDMHVTDRSGEHHVEAAAGHGTRRRYETPRGTHYVNPVNQGWKITEAAVLAALGQLPEHETVVDIPKRMMQVFPEVNGGGRAGV